MYDIYYIMSYNSYNISKENYDGAAIKTCLGKSDHWN
jgi:hypothetical protein